MKILRNTENIVLQVGINIDRIEYQDMSNVIRVETNIPHSYIFYIATDDRDNYEILERNDIPEDYYPSGYYLVGDVWTYIPKPVLPDPSLDYLTENYVGS